MKSGIPIVKHIFSISEMIMEITITSSSECPSQHPDKVGLFLACFCTILAPG